MKYIARINETGKEQLLIDHLENVAKMTAAFAKKI